MKEKNIDFNPYGVKRAIENTALNVDETIGTGAGLIQVVKKLIYNSKKFVTIIFLVKF